MKLKNLIAWDLLLSILVALVVYWRTPTLLPNIFVKDLYGTGISVLSIVFSIFFAALAVIISSSGDDFVQFLMEGGEYFEIISNYRFTLILLFLALSLSLILYGFTAFWISAKIGFQSQLFLAVFVFFTTYALLATVNSAHDSITWANFRAKFLEKKKAPRVD